MPDRSDPAAPARRRAGLVAGLGVTAVALAVSVALMLPGDVAGGDVIATTAGVQGLAPEDPAPAPAGPTLLAIAPEGVPVPDLGARGWRPVGMRQDRVHGRTATTVEFERGGRRLGYSVVSGPPLDAPGSARRAARSGTLLRSFDVGGRTVVTLVRRGHTVVVSAVGVPRRALYDLAGWRGGGTIPF